MAEDEARRLGAHAGTDLPGSVTFIARTERRDTWGAHAGTDSRLGALIAEAEAEGPLRFWCALAALYGTRGRAQRARMRRSPDASCGWTGRAGARNESLPLWRGLPGVSAGAAQMPRAFLKRLPSANMSTLVNTYVAACSGPRRRSPPGARWRGLIP